MSILVVQLVPSRNRNCVSRDKYFTALETRPANRPLLFVRRVEFSNIFFRELFRREREGEKKRKKKKSRVMVNSFIMFHTTHARLPVYPILLFCFRLVEIVQPILSPPVPLFFKYACFSRRDDPSFSATEKFRTIRSPSSLSLSLFFAMSNENSGNERDSNTTRTSIDSAINTAIEYR